MSSSQLPPVRRYLWAQGKETTPLPKGTSLAGRYQVIDYPILKDTQPDSPPPPLDEVPVLAAPYLVLSPYSIAIPRPFTQVVHPDGQSQLLLLEEAPLQAIAETDTPTLLPALSEVWTKATTLYQLTWLWRIAQLWQPCVDTQTAHCLLDAQNIRVDGEDIRLLELEQAAKPLSLVDLGRHWQTLVPTAAADLRPYLTQLTTYLINGQGNADGLVHSLISAVEQQSTQRPMQVQVATYSDKGPTRSRNEDACFPPSGSVYDGIFSEGNPQNPAPLVIVCDGVGGHEGGDVASQTAIAEISQRLNSLIRTPKLSHTAIVEALKEAIFVANQAITEGNDADHREDRERMGTTVVMALVYGGRLFIAHLGDSRAYRVRSHSCRQITLDDDVAAREMRLGLELYQDALQQPGAGALVQALGMANASYLHPTVAMHPITTETVLLLCSDGLSDNDLIDQVWRTELLPTLGGDRSVASAGQALIALANRYNGHDNVTVGLLRLTPQLEGAIAPVPPALADQCAVAPSRPVETPAVTQVASVATRRRSGQTGDRSKPRLFPLLITSVLTAAILGGIGALGWQWYRRQSIANAPRLDSQTGETLAPSATPPTPEVERTTGNLSVGDFLQVRQLPDPTAAAILLDTESPPVPPPPDAVDLPARVLSVGSIVQIMSRQRTSNGELWVRLQVCSAANATADGGGEGATQEVPSNLTAGETRTLPLATPGDQGWLLQANLSVFAEQLLDTSDNQRGLCID